MQLFLYDETANFKNLKKKTLNHLAVNGCFNQLSIGDCNSSLNRDLNYVDYSAESSVSAL